MKIRRLVFVLVILIITLLLAGFVGASAIVYDRLSRTSAGCSQVADRDNTPAQFDTNELDTTPYLMPDYQEVTFLSRQDGLALAAWYVPAPDAAPETAPTVILVHGLASCKASPSILIPAGMLHHAGYNTLMLDLRDHGSSTVEDGRFAGGTDEYLDVLGAWDWLVNERDIAPERIGLFGTSLGAATVMIAFGEEARAATVWEDSGFADINTAINAELERNGFPTFLSLGAVLMGRVLAGDDIAAFSPLQAAHKANGRPVFITHGDQDRRLSVAYAYDLAAALQESGQTVEPWILAGLDHVQGMFKRTADYEERLIAFFNSALAQG
jgi:dipeptidyl aminopeptidase/acylaminoacyl peptidase